MKVVFPVNQKVIRIKIPNILLLNRFTFFLIKLIFGIWFYPLTKIKYKQIKPLIKMAKGYKGFEIVNVKTQNGENIIVCL